MARVCGSGGCGAVSIDPIKPERLPDYLEDAIKRIDMAAKYLASASQEMQDRLCDEDDDAIEVNMLRDSLVRCIEVVGQCLHNAQIANSEFEQKHALNASGWWGMRSKISHGYDGVQYEIVLAVIKQDMPALREKLTQALAAWSKSC